MDNGDAEALKRLLRDNPSLVRQTIQWGPQRCKIGPCAPVQYLAQARFNAYATHNRSHELTRLLLESGAPVNGLPGDGESPLITAASYHEIGVARALVEGGADLESTGYAVPIGTALAHAVNFGAPEIVDLLVAAGARIRSLAEAAGAGLLPAGWRDSATAGDLGSALRAAAVCNRFGVIDELLAAGASIDSQSDGGTALHWAAWEAKADSARHLVQRGANPLARDPKYNLTPLGWARHRAAECPSAHPDGGHARVIEFLEERERLGPQSA